MKPLIHLFCAFAAVPLAACSTMSPPLQTVARVDLPNFMGDWYVIASIPTFIERNAYNAIESYELIADRVVATTFRFNQDSFDGPLKTYRPTGYVSEDPSNAIWGMQFFWPIKADYRVIYLNKDYTHTVIGRNKRDYVWVMARTPYIPEPDYINILRLVEEQGYDISKVRRVPHRHYATEGLQP
jgi:apolipoprotein D and lipocalin family protein